MFRGQIVVFIAFLNRSCWCEKECCLSLLKQTKIDQAKNQQSLLALSTKPITKFSKPERQNFQVCNWVRLLLQCTIRYHFPFEGKPPKARNLNIVDQPTLTITCFWEASLPKNYTLAKWGASKSSRIHWQFCSLPYFLWSLHTHKNTHTNCGPLPPSSPSVQL